MKKIKTPFKGLLVYKGKRYNDKRGFLREVFQKYIIKKNLTITASASQGIFNNMAELKLGSDSVLPHVRSDVVKYLKQSQDFAIDNLKINYFMQPRKDLFTKITAGYDNFCNFFY